MMKKSDKLKIGCFSGIGCVSALIYQNVESCYISIPLILILSTLLGIVLRKICK